MALLQHGSKLLHWCPACQLLWAPLGELVNLFHQQLLLVLNLTCSKPGCIATSIATGILFLLVSVMSCVSSVSVTLLSSPLPVSPSAVVLSATVCLRIWFSCSRAWQCWCKVVCGGTLTLTHTVYTLHCAHSNTPCHHESSEATSQTP